MYHEEIKIPKERVGVLIGKNGEVKRQIEKRGKVKLNIDSKEGIAIIDGDESMDIFEVAIIIKAIARGFSPQTAFKLFNPDNHFELMEIPDYTRKSKKSVMRVKARVIGSEGKARKTLEQLTGTDISIYGKTIGIIGEPERVHMARRAIEMLLQGSPHGNVYKWLESKRKEMRRRTFEELAVK